jgi:Oxidoreductase-like protein, N-terminal
VSEPADDPEPQPPERPLASDCCDSGCERCVFDIYDEEMAGYRVRLAQWRRRHGITPAS